MKTRGSLFAGRAEEDFVVDLAPVFKAVSCRIPTFVGIAAVILVLGLGYCIWAEPLYVARCRMMVEPGRLRVTQIQDVYDAKTGSDFRSRDDFMSTQMYLIRSEHILSCVFKHFKFAERKVFSDEEEPLKELAERVELERLAGTSLIDVGFCSEDPAFSAEVANYIAHVYMEDCRQRADGFSRYGLETLQKEQKEREAARRRAADRLEAFRQEHGILSAEASQALGVARLAELDKASVKAQEELAQAQAVVDAVDAWGEQGRSLDALPEAVQDATLTQFKLVRLQAQADLIRMLRDFGGGHRNVAVQRNILAEMDKVIAAETEKRLFAARARLEQARSRVRIIREERERAAEDFRTFDRLSGEYRMLEDDLKAAENACRLVLQRVNELQIARGADGGMGGTFQIIAPARPPVRAEYPEKSLVAVVTVLLAGVISVLVCMVLDTAARRRRIKKLHDPSVR